MNLAVNFWQIVKKANQNLLPALLGLILLTTATSAKSFIHQVGEAGNGSSAAVANEPSVEFGRTWVDYDITQGGVKGMRVHTKFTVNGMKGIPGYLAVFFQKKDGTKLFTNNRAYRSKEGQVAVYFEINPGYDRTVYEDAQVFIPYSEFSLPKGTYNLQMDIDVIYENGDLVQHLTLHDFEYSLGAPTNTTTTTPKSTSVEFGRVWVDYDVTQGGVKGMRIHAKFTVNGMKDVPGYLAVFFQKKDGTKLFTNNRAYRSKEGQVAVYFEITPGYDRTVYEDAQLFIPYSEFSLPKGNYDLQMDVDVIYENGDLVQHLTLHDFWYQK